MAKVSFKIVAANSPFTLSDNKDELIPSYNEGQIIFAEGLRKIYLDFHDKRTCYTPSGLNYVGIASEKPTDDKTDIKIGGSTYHPNNLDMVVYEKKEYLFRDGGWYEIGDEDSPTWNI